MAKRKAREEAVVRYVGKTDIPFPPDLPVVLPGIRPSKKDILKISSFVCLLYASDKLTLKKSLRAAGIRSESTFHEWRKAHEEIETEFQNARVKKADVYRQDIQETAISSLKKQITGFVVDTTEITEEVEIRTAEEGGQEEVVTSRKIKQKKTYVRPSVTATIFALSNLDSKNFKRNVTEDDIEGDKSVNIPVIRWVD